MVVSYFHNVDSSYLGIWNISPSVYIIFDFFHQCNFLCTVSLSGGGGGLVPKLCPTLAILWTAAFQAPLSMGFSRQEYWSGLPFSSPGDLPDPGIEPGSPALQADDLPTEL